MGVLDIYGFEVFEVSKNIQSFFINEEEIDRTVWKTRFLIYVILKSQSELKKN